MKFLTLCAVLGMAALSACSSSDTPTQPASGAPALGATLQPQAKPGYEEAYADGNTYLINAIEVPNHAPRGAQADLYEIVYPIGWENMGVNPPQCNPCDHEGNGIDFTDYHDHVLDSVPSSPGHGEYSPLWHVYAIIPAYGSDPAANAAVSAAYASHLPIKSEADALALLDMTMPGGAPLAAKIDTGIYFLCAVVNPNANK